MDPQQQNPTEKTARPNYLPLLVVIACLFLISAAFLTLFKKNKVTTGKILPSSTPTAAEPAVTTAVKTGNVNLAVKDNQGASVGQTVTLQLTVESAGANIIGLDALVAYRPDAFDYVAARSLSPQFTAFAFNRTDYLSLTVARNLSIKTPTILSGAPLVELVFKAKKAGSYPFEIRPKIEKETTKMVGDLTKILYPNVSGVTVAIK